MRALLDTHAFLWWIEDNPRLSLQAREIIGDAGNEIYLSAISGLEIVIKARLGRIKLPEDPVNFILEQVAVNAFRVLPIYLRHALYVYTLPLIHRDPFDRILIAQSQLEDMPLITADSVIERYPVKVIW
ncbi:MAG: type II toxin-antitoxin system VapC family toxin [Chloroflexi bacterium]|nr:MAG: type II toxin-antitoxin system VapC family toxin [Chloroflexota bacterium]HDN79958.1 type II toxin-antitoxin system VapC family toxin [Chloroflexota bacterium]